MDIGQITSHAAEAPKQDNKPTFKPFARPRRKRQRILPPKPALIAVRHNPSYYVLNFNDSDRPERSLLNLVLSDKRAISVVGLPGAGKSVILRGLAYHPSASTTFRAGIFLIPLLATTTLERFFDHLCEVLQKLDAVSYVPNVRRLLTECKMQPNPAVIQAIISPIRDKRCLILFDNVSPSPDDVFHALRAFVLASPRHRSYTLVCSTRSHDIAAMFSNGTTVDVHLLDPVGDASRDVLCAHATFNRSHFDTSCAAQNSSVPPVLQKCSGLPLALAVAGGAVKRLMGTTATATGHDIIWNHYRAYLTNSFGQFGLISGLFSSLTSCVDSVTRDKNWKTTLDTWHVFCSLGATPHGAWIPYQILQRLWGIHHKDDVISVVRPLSRHCLLRRERRGVAVGVMIPDIILDFCRHVAEKRMGLRKWHLDLLTSYVEQADRITKSPTTTQWPRFAEEEQYLREHLKHHTSHAVTNAIEPELAQLQHIADRASIVIYEHVISTKRDAVYIVNDG